VTQLLQTVFGPVLYVVSAILWFWHKVFGTLLGPNNGFAWALAVFFLVFSLRALLLKPALSQIRSARKMAKFAPQIQKLREKYKGDRQKMTEEMQKLQSEQGVNPLGGCLPMLVQIPVFLSLYNVLRGFHPNSPSNYIFDRAGVKSFVDASIFGAKLSNWIIQPSDQLAAFGTTRTDMIVVGVPLMIIASVATFFTMRMSQRRQTDVSMANPQSAMVGKAMMYLAPVGALVSGWFLPLAVLLYWLANNTWTLGQAHFLSNKVDREVEREKQREIETKKAAPRPRPGQKPTQAKRSGSSGATTTRSVQAKNADTESSQTQTKKEPSARREQSSSSASDSQAASKPDTGAAADSAAQQPEPAEPAGASAGAANTSKTNGKRPGNSQQRKPQPKNRPGKSPAGSRKSQKRRR
jgi:YidC/Oxa1 family membrane protein insertase